MALQPVTFRPVTAIKPVTRKPENEAPAKLAERKRPRRARDPGMGGNLDLLV